MDYQAIYNATYNYFTGEKCWPEPISYNPDWEFSKDAKVRNAFNLGKRDGNVKRINSESNTEDVDSNFIDIHTNHSEFQEIKKR